MTPTERDDDNQPLKRERATTGRIDAPATCADPGEADDGGTPDLDQREQGQSPKRKAAGPSGPTRPAPQPSSVDDDEQAPEAWGTDPADMPPTEPAPPPDSDATGPSDPTTPAEPTDRTTPTDPS
jgi:hypothetical protein